MSFSATVLTLYPEMFPGPLGCSLSGKALLDSRWSLNIINMRDFATDRHGTVDGRPAGGGAGMVLRADIIAKALDSLPKSAANFVRLLPSARGEPLTQEKIKHFAGQGGIVLVAGHFEGVDERVIKGRNLQEVSIGDYILSGGEIASMVILDSIVRLLPGILGNEMSSCDESFEGGLLEYPQYTNPDIWEGHKIPDILKGGNHRAVEEWRAEQALKLTQSRRPDLLLKKAKKV